MPPDEYDLTIVDVLACPQLAEEANVIATPTLLRAAPPPVRRIVGDLSDMERILAWIGFPSSGTSGRTNTEKKDG
jgi:circadian clock protein KaiB